MENIINFLSSNNTTPQLYINSILVEIDEIINESINFNETTNDNNNYDRQLLENMRQTFLDAFSVNTFLNFEHNPNLDLDNDNTTYYELEDVKIHLSQYEYDNFKKKRVTNRFITKLNENICNICLEPYKLRDLYVTLQCKHNFHDTCIQTWLLNQSTKCPTCRHPCK